jgi:basic amino acid/polyamine antiporter, APA family
MPAKDVDSGTVAHSKKISLISAVAIVVGIVIGPGIFKTPAIVASNSSGDLTMLLLWLIGGAISFIGALCYAELTSTYPHAGGEYHYLFRSFGEKLAFLFAWARMTVIQTGSIAILAFIIGDYATEAFNLGAFSSSIYALITVVILTAVNLRGLYPSSNLQKYLIAAIFLGLLSIVVVGLFSGPSPILEFENPVRTEFALGQALIFVLLTYGGWNEAAYLSSDVGHKKRGIIKVLFYSIGLITFIYLLINFALLKGLGFDGISNSSAVAADLFATVLGEEWVRVISLIIAVAAFSTVNAVMITGARTNYALGKDFKRFSFLASGSQAVPRNALLLQAFISFLLILLGTTTRSGFVTMVEYTAPVFWFFFFLVGVALFVLRKKDPHRERPYKVPLYPVIPLLFCAVSLYMLWSSLVYTGIGALIGVAVLITGIPFLLLNNHKLNREVK